MRQIVRTEDVFYVYVYLNPLKNMQPFYVGRGKGDRAFHHLRASSSRNRHKSRTISKIRRETGGDPPPVIIHKSGLSYDESCRIERELIAEYGRADLGTGTLTNLTDGGEGISGASEETRRQMSLAKVDTIAVISLDGRRFRVARDDPRWVSGELVGQTKGIPASDIVRRRAGEVNRGKKLRDLYTCVTH